MVNRLLLGELSIDRAPRISNHLEIPAPRRSHEARPTAIDSNFTKILA
jgi:hypothetical protein